MGRSLYQSIISRQRQSVGESHCYVMDEEGPRYAVGMDYVQTLCWITGYQPYHVGELRYVNNKFGSLPMGPMKRLERDSSFAMVPIKDKDLDVRAYEDFRMEARRWFGYEDFVTMMTFVHHRIDGLKPINETIKAHIVLVNSLNIAGLRDSNAKIVDNMKASILQAFEESISYGPVTFSRLLDFYDDLEYDVNQYQSSFIDKLRKKYTYYRNQSKKAGYLMTFDHRYFIISIKDAIAMRFDDSINFEYLEATTTKEVIHQMPEKEIFVWKCQDEFHGGLYRISVMGCDGMYRLKLQVNDDRLFNKFCSKIRSILASHPFKVYLTQRKLTGWIGREEVQKIKDMRDLQAKNEKMEDDNRRMEQEISDLLKRLNISDKNDNDENQNDEF